MIELTKRLRHSRGLDRQYAGFSFKRISLNRITLSVTGYDFKRMVTAWDDVCIQAITKHNWKKITASRAINGKKSYDADIRNTGRYLQIKFEILGLLKFTSSVPQTSKITE